MASTYMLEIWLYSICTCFAEQRQVALSNVNWPQRRNIFIIPYGKSFRTKKLNSSTTWPKCSDMKRWDEQWCFKACWAVISESLNEEHKGFRGKRHSHWICTDTHSLLAHKNSFLTAKKSCRLVQLELVNVWRKQDYPW